MSGYKTDCPACPGTNFWITPNNGIGYCFNCGYYQKDGKANHKPRVISKDVKEYRALYTQATNYYHSSLDGKAYAYLHNRGFDDKTIQELKIGYCPIGKHPLYKNKHAQEAGLIDFEHNAFLADRITFPYLTETGSITDIRGRSMIANDDTKYKSLLGSSYYRGAIYPYNYHLRKSKRILITEGEIKADIATQIGYPTMALPGMGIWRSGFRQQPDTEYIILFDSQRHNMYLVNRAIAKAAQNIDGVKIAALPLMNKEKQDIDSFILTYGNVAFSMVINGALPYDEWLQLHRF